MCLLMLFTAVHSSIAQDMRYTLPPKWQLYIGGVFTSEKVVDNTFSSIPYSGINLGAISAIKYQTRKSSHVLRASYSAGKLSTKIFPQSGLRKTYFTLDYSNLYKLGNKTEGSLTCELGGSMNILYTGRNYNNFINSNYSFELAASFSGAFQASYTFSHILSGFTITDQFNIPVISSVLQPAFGNESFSAAASQSGPDLKAFFNKGRIGSFPYFFRLINSLCINRAITKQHHLSLNYSWDYYQISGSRQVTQANHLMSLMYCFIF